MAYAGDSPSKKVARAQLYIALRHIFKDRLGAQTSSAIVLAGDEGAEIGAL